MASGKGTATLDFGTGSSDASVDVTGQAGLTVSDYAEAWFMADATASNGADDHILAASLCTPTCSVPVDGTLRITVYSTVRLTGQFTIRWVWSN